jgi:hypothetical protein
LTPTPANPLTYAQWWFEKNGNGPIPGFEAFEPNPQYNFKQRPRARGEQWPIIEPENAPAVAMGVDDIMYKMIKVSWEFSEPQGGAQRGMAGGHSYDPIVMGTRGMPQSLAQVFQPPGEVYHPQVRPTAPVLDVKMPNNAAIASDWALHETIQRTNAVTFRADKRPPYEVIVNQGAFNPPVSRTDRYYLENNIYGAFSGYMQRRYGRPIAADKMTFLRAVDRELTTPAAKELLFEYLVWLSITKKESAHLGRMVDNECLKGWISTAKCIDNSLNFAVMGGTGGWLYILIVHSGYVVPFSARMDTVWGTPEAEIAQYGSVPADRIVGFTYFGGDRGPEGPIFIRKSFRESEPKAFEFMFNALSGMSPV